MTSDSNEPKQLNPMCDKGNGSHLGSTAVVSRRDAVKGIAGVIAAATLEPSFGPLASTTSWTPDWAAAEAQSKSESTKTAIQSRQTLTLGQFLVSVSKTDLGVRHQADPSRSLWESRTSRPFIEAGVGSATFREHGNPLGSFDVRDSVSSLERFRSIDSIDAVDASTIVLSGTLAGSRSTSTFRVVFHAISENQLRFVIDLPGNNAGRFNRLFLRYASSRKEAFFGFGQQLTHFNQKGNLIPMLVQEHGIGRGLPVITQLVDLRFDGAGGNPYLTEAPAPQYITSQLRSLFLENKGYCVFDLRATDHVAIKLFSGTMTGRIVFGQKPLDLIEEYSFFSGRVRELPPWAHDGVIVAAQGGTATVNALLTKLIEAKVPLVGLWIQDWSGVKTTSAGQQVLWNWQLSSSQYPDWDKLVERLAQQNARVFIYINPFLVPSLCAPENAQSCSSQLYMEALNKSYLVKQNGTVFTYINSSIRAGMLDLSNPEARTWTKQLIQREMIEKAKASGWMGDFGEALPFDADLFAGADPQFWHNHYPEAWAHVQREAIDETGRGEDFLFWNRSGFSQSPSYSTAGWLGDQLQTWDEFDGIKTAVVGLLSGGISGFSILHSDTGGYVAAKLAGHPVIARSKELLMRWMELNAFTALFRTHEGLIPSISAQVDADSETISHLAKFGTIYKLLAPYRKHLVEQASKRGYPVVRHPFLHFPNDPIVYALRYEFMLGPDFLIAPVLDKGITDLRVYLPSGEWIHLWTGQNYRSDKGHWVQVAAPLGQPPVFFTKGSLAGEQLLVNFRDIGIIR